MCGCPRDFGTKGRCFSVPLHVTADIRSRPDMEPQCQTATDTLHSHVTVDEKQFRPSAPKSRGQPFYVTRTLKYTGLLKFQDYEMLKSITYAGLYILIFRSINFLVFIYSGLTIQVQLYFRTYY